MDNLSLDFDWYSFIRSFGTLSIFFIAFIYFCLTTPNFAEPASLSSIAARTVPLAIASIGLTLTMIVGEIDLSLGGSIGLVATLFTGLITNQGLPWVVVIPVVMLVGLAVGAINGWLIVRFKLSSFLVTVATMFVTMGIERLYSLGRSIWFRGAAGAVRHFYASDFLLGVPNPLFILIIVVLLTWLWRSQTKTGVHLRAIGENIQAAREVGIKVPLLKMGAFTLAGGFYAAGAILYTLRTSGAIAYAGQNMLLSVMGAVFIGGALFSLKPNILGSIVGAGIFGFIRAGMTMSGISSTFIIMVQGLVLLFAVALVNIRERNIEQVKF